MILVIVGTHNQAFDRLVRASDELAADLEEPVVIQYGSSGYRLHHAQGFDFTGGERMDALVSEARVIISHAAAGTILLSCHKHKPMVIVPRLKEYHEHIDDHQKQLAFTLSRANRVVVVLNPTAQDLKEAIEQAPKLISDLEGPGQLVTALKEQLLLWKRERCSNHG
jgi:beta-1,4-N-acetylglucosaminyltransferase